MKLVKRSACLGSACFEVWTFSMCTSWLTSWSGSNSCTLTCSLLTLSSKGARLWQVSLQLLASAKSFKVSWTSLIKTVKAASVDRSRLCEKSRFDFSSCSKLQSFPQANLLAKSTSFPSKTKGEKRHTRCTAAKSSLWYWTRETFSEFCSIKRNSKQIKCCRRSYSLSYSKRSRLGS